MKNKQWGKMLSLFVAASMVFSVTVPAYAQPAEDVVTMIDVDEAAVNQEAVKADEPGKVGETVKITSKHGWTAEVSIDNNITRGSWNDDVTPPVLNIDAANASMVTLTAQGKAIVDDKDTGFYGIKIVNNSKHPVRVVNDTEFIGHIFEYTNVTGESTAKLQAGDGTVIVNDEKVAAFGTSSGVDTTVPTTQGGTYGTVADADYTVATLSETKPDEDFANQKITFTNKVKLYREDASTQVKTAVATIIGGTWLGSSKSTKAENEFSLTNENPYTIGATNSTTESITYLVEEFANGADNPATNYSKYTATIQGIPSIETMGLKDANKARYGLLETDGLSQKDGVVTLAFSQGDCKTGLDYTVSTATDTTIKGTNTTEWSTLATSGSNQLLSTKNRMPAAEEYRAFVRKAAQSGSTAFASDWVQMADTTSSPLTYIDGDATKDNAIRVEEVFEDPGWTIYYGTGSTPASETGSKITGRATVDGTGLSVFSKGGDFVVSALGQATTSTGTAINSIILVPTKNKTSLVLEVGANMTNGVTVRIPEDLGETRKVTFASLLANVTLGTATAAVGDNVNFAYVATENVVKPGSYTVGSFTSGDATASGYFSEDTRNSTLTLSKTKNFTILPHTSTTGATHDYDGFEKSESKTADVMDLAQLAGKGNSTGTAANDYAARVLALTDSYYYVGKELKTTQVDYTGTEKLTQVDIGNNSATFTLEASNADYLIVENMPSAEDPYDDTYQNPEGEGIVRGTTGEDQNTEIKVSGLGDGKNYAFYIRHAGTDSAYPSRWVKLNRLLKTNVAGLLNVTGVTGTTAKVDMSKVSGVSLYVLRGLQAIEYDDRGVLNADSTVTIDQNSGALTGLEPGNLYNVWVKDLDGKYYEVDNFTTPTDYQMSGNVINAVLPINSKSTLSDNMGLSANALSGNVIIADLSLDRDGKNKYLGYTKLEYNVAVDGITNPAINVNATPENNVLAVGNVITTTVTATIDEKEYTSNVLEFKIGEAVEEPTEPGIQVTVAAVPDQKSGVSKNEVEAAIIAATTVTAVSDNSTVSDAEISVSFNESLSDNIVVDEDKVFDFTVSATKDGETATAAGTVKVLADKPAPPVEDKLTVEVGSVSDQQSGVAKSAVETDIKAATTVKDVSGNTVSDAVLTVTWDGEVSDNIVVTEDTTFKFTVTAEKDGISGNGLGQVVVKKAEEPTPSENKLSVSVGQIAAFAFGTTKADIETEIKKATTVSDNKGTVSPDSLSVNWTTAMADGAQEPAADTAYTFTVTATKAECTPGTSTPQTVTVKAKEAEETHKEATVEGMGVESDIVNVDYNPSAKKQFTTGSYLITFSDGKMIELEINGEGGTIGDLTDDDYKNAFELKKVKYKNNKKAVNKKSPQVIPTLKASKGSALKNQIKALNKAFKKTELGYFTINPCDVSSGTHSLEVKINTKKNVVKSIKVDGKKVGKKEFTSTAVDGGYQIAFSGNFAGTIVIDTNGIIIG